MIKKSTLKDSAIAWWALMSCVGMLWLSLACIYVGALAWHNLNPPMLYFLWALPGLGLTVLGLVLLKKANRNVKKT